MELYKEGLHQRLLRIRLESMYNKVETDKENKEQCLLSLKVVEDNTKFP